MNKHVQICEKNHLGDSYKVQIGSELGAKLYFSKDFLQGLVDDSDVSEIKINLNISFAIYESNYLSLFK